MQNGIEWFYCKWVGFGDVTILGQASNSGFMFKQFNDKCIAGPPEKNLTTAPCITCGVSIS